MLISLDGFFENPNKELEWHNVDAEFNDYAIDLINEYRLMIHPIILGSGKRTFQEGHE